jgi:hypothetical protein
MYKKLALQFSLAALACGSCAVQAAPITYQLWATSSSITSTGTNFSGPQSFLAAGGLRNSLENVFSFTVNESGQRNGNVSLVTSPDSDRVTTGEGASIRYDGISELKLGEPFLPQFKVPTGSPDAGSTRYFYSGSYMTDEQGFLPGALLPDRTDSYTFGVDISSGYPVGSLNIRGFCRTGCRPTISYTNFSGDFSSGWQGSRTVIDPSPGYDALTRGYFGLFWTRNGEVVRTASQVPLAGTLSLVSLLLVPLGASLIRKRKARA